MMDAKRLQQIRDDVARDSGLSMENAYADRAWLLKELDDAIGRLELAKDAWQKLAAATSQLDRVENAFQMSKALNPASLE